MRLPATQGMADPSPHDCPYERRYCEETNEPPLKNVSGHRIYSQGDDADTADG